MTLDCGFTNTATLPILFSSCSIVGKDKEKLIVAIKESFIEKCHSFQMIKINMNYIKQSKEMYIKS